MKIAIYGAGKFGEYVGRKIKENVDAGIEISVFIDNNVKYSGLHKCEKPIVDLEDFFRCYVGKVDRIIIAASDAMIAQEMALSLIKQKYFNIYMIPEAVYSGQLPIFFNGKLASYIKLFDQQKPILPYLEYHVSDFCNLKCKGCGHFSNRVNEKFFRI